MSVQILLRSSKGARMAQLVEHPTEKPGGILTQVRALVRQGIFFFFFLIPESISSADSLTVSKSPPVQSRALASVCMIKIPNSGSYTVVWTHEHCCTH